MTSISNSRHLEPLFQAFAVFSLLIYCWPLWYTISDTSYLRGRIDRLISLITRSDITNRGMAMPIIFSGWASEHLPMVSCRLTTVCCFCFRSPYVTSPRMTWCRSHFRCFYRLRGLTTNALKNFSSNRPKSDWFIRLQLDRQREGMGTLHASIDVLVAPVFLSLLRQSTVKEKT